MKLFREIVPLRVAFARYIETASIVKKMPFVPPSRNGNKYTIEPLSERILVRVQGDEVVPFLQGLITNDMHHLESNRSSMYTTFLNKAGRVLYDSIIYRTASPDAYLIECDKNVSSELRRHLRLYRVRRKIDIEEADKDYVPWVIFNAEGEAPHVNHSQLSPDICSTLDPRVSDLGLRVLAGPDKTWIDLSIALNIAMVPSTDECNYRLHRYHYGVAEGVRELPPGKSFPLEINCDFMHGVSFHKGCYIGQELTARVHHTGVVRKRIMPLRLTAPITTENVIVQSEAGANLGTVRGFLRDRALALLRVEQVLFAPKLMIDGEICYTEKPKWWPIELPHKATMRE